MGTHPVLQSVQTANPPTPSQPDRSGWLIAFGVVEILFGIVYLALAASSLVNVFRHPDHVPLLGAFTFWSLLGVSWSVLGVGSVLKRNWARVAVLGAAWAWIICGAIGTIIFSVAGPAIMELGRKNHPGSQSDPVITAIVLIFMVLSFAAVMLVPPSVMGYFYSRPSVRATCVHGIFVPKLPTLLAVVAGWEFMGAAVMLLCLSIWAKVMIFGFVAEYFATKLATILTLAGHVYAGWALSQGHKSGWKLALANALFWLASAFVTLAWHGPVGMYRELGSSNTKIQFFQEHPVIVASLLAISLGLRALDVAALLLAKRYLPVAAAPPSSSHPQSISMVASDQAY